MRIKHISVNKLFGIFNHQIPMNTEDRITILFGPNGFGKTFVLKLVNAVFHSDYGEIMPIPFSDLTLEFDDNSMFRLIKQINKVGEKLKFEYTKEGSKHEYSIPEKDEPDWLEEIKKSIRVQFINTERLMHFTEAGRTGSELAVKKYAMELKELIEEKPEVFDNLTDKIELFVRIVNSKFIHKRMEISKDSGFVFTSSDGKILRPENLSSGEQHAVVLFHVLLFKVQSDTLILIDEPELSLHVVWQQQFIKDIQDIIRLDGFDVLVATHSPQIIHDRWDLAVALKDPRA